MPNHDAKLRFGPMHLNFNVMCAVDIRTGGPDPSVHDLLEICVMPLNHSYRPHEEFLPFHICMRPSFKVDMKYAKLNRERFQEQFENSTTDSIDAAELFEAWWKRIRSKDHKKIQFLCWDWIKIYPWIKYWLAPTTYEEMIHNSYRDMQTVMHFINDRQDIRGEIPPCKSQEFAMFLSTNNIEQVDRNSLISNCKALSDVYRAVLLKSL